MNPAFPARTPAEARKRYTERMSDKSMRYNLRIRHRNGRPGGTGGMLCQHMAALTECIQFPDLLQAIRRRSGVWKLACILFYFNNDKYSYY